MAEGLSRSKKRLKKYIQEQLRKGRSSEEIRKHLVSYGHNDRDIEILLEEVIVGDTNRRRKAIHHAFEALFIILFILFVFWVSATSSSPGEAIVVGFLPVIAFIAVSSFLIDQREQHLNLLMALPLILAFLYYISGSIGDVPILSQMEVGKLALLNMIISYVFLATLHYSDIMDQEAVQDLISPEEEIKRTRQERITEAVMPQQQFSQQSATIQSVNSQAATYQAATSQVAASQAARPVIEITPRDERSGYLSMPAPQEEPLDRLVHSIEDKVKAINGVIGRVYRRSNGGTELVRNLIKIRSEWYNEFNALAKSRDKEKIIALLDKIERRLNRLFRTERDVFGNTNFRNLKREKGGTSKIIDVLKQNDNDPVDVYLENALISCGRIRDRIAGML